MSRLDWLIVGAFLLFSLVISLRYRKRAGGSPEDFFLSGRSLPWYVAGLSMVATTFGADTPLSVAGLVARNGISGNWIWWNMLIGGMLTVFFFARLWRRAGVLTDLEFVEFRYAGRPAAFLRGMRAIYFGLLLNCIIMGWVNLAMAKILLTLFPGVVTHNNVFLFLGAALVLTACYSAISGLWGVAVTDAFQFCLAMGGCIYLAFVALRLPEIGGIAGLKAQLPEGTFHMLPRIGGDSGGGGLEIAAGAFVAYIAVQWWASWYPGAEPGGGGYIAQRMMSSKNEHHAIGATFFFQIAHYCLRPWPWILVGLCAMVLYPNLADKESGFIMVINDHLPAGVKGLLIAAFLAAYMSTISSQLNWGASYFVNDFYKRFLRRKATDRSLVLAARVFTVLLMLLSLVVTMLLGDVATGWQIVLEFGAGIGLVMILRWYWWRINAWSEIAATFSPVLFYLLAHLLDWNLVFPNTLFAIVPFSLLIWMATLLLTKPESDECLRRFFIRVHPGGPGWRHIARNCPEVQADRGLLRLAANWAIGVAVVYLALFGIGSLIFSEFGKASILLGSATLAAFFLFVNQRRIESNAGER